jgi:hypothetical protein
MIAHFKNRVGDTYCVSPASQPGWHGEDYLYEVIVGPHEIKLHVYELPYGPLAPDTGDRCETVFSGTPVEFLAKFGTEREEAEEG